MLRPPGSTRTDTLFPSTTLFRSEHLLALISSPRRVANADFVSPLLCTTIDPLFPRLLLNVESGDYGYLSRRGCGCLLGKAGLSLHRSEEHTSELQSLMRISYAVFCLKKKNKKKNNQ